jgi:NTP pyrophosphatase (non-canonical NTP hydrolase)
MTTQQKMIKRYPDSIGDMNYAYDLIQKEHWRQAEKWGVQKVTLFEWMCYLTEEVGELAEAISENTYRNGPIKNITTEAVHVAALACKIIEILRPYETHT